MAHITQTENELKTIEAKQKLGLPLSEQETKEHLILRGSGAVRL